MSAKARMPLTKSNAIRGMISAEWNKKSYTDDQWWYIDRILPKEFTEHDVPFSEVEPLYKALLKALRSEYGVNYAPPSASVVAKCCAMVLRKPQDTPENRHKGASADEVAIIMSSYRRSGDTAWPEYVAGQITAGVPVADIQAVMDERLPAVARAATTSKRGSEAVGLPELVGGFTGAVPRESKFVRKMDKLAAAQG